MPRVPAHPAALTRTRTLTSPRPGGYLADPRKTVPRLLEMETAGGFLPQLRLSGDQAIRFVRRASFGRPVSGEVAVFLGDKTALARPGVGKLSNPSRCFDTGEMPVKIHFDYNKIPSQAGTVVTLGTLTVFIWGTRKLCGRPLPWPAHCDCLPW